MRHAHRQREDHWHGQGLHAHGQGEGCMGKEKAAWERRKLHGQGETCMGKEKAAWGRRKLHGQGEGCMGKEKAAWTRRKLHGKGEGCMGKKKAAWKGEGCMGKEKAAWTRRRLHGKGEGCMDRRKLHGSSNEPPFLIPRWCPQHLTLSHKPIACAHTSSSPEPFPAGSALLPRQPPPSVPGPPRPHHTFPRSAPASPCCLDSVSRISGSPASARSNAKYKTSHTMPARAPSSPYPDAGSALHSERGLVGLVSGRMEDGGG
eukprot:365075-Chlamydomonas_euryale.AAC.18